MNAVSSEITNSPIETRFRERTPGSLSRNRRAQDVFPSGIVHDARKMWPYPLYVESGRRGLISGMWMAIATLTTTVATAHLILGHGDDRVLTAVHEQLERGTHYAACHDLELEWGERVLSLVPCAELFDLCLRVLKPT